MSVALNSRDGTVEENVSNGTWMAVVACARAYEPGKVPNWDGTHDWHLWTPEQLRIMADRLEQTAAMVAILRDLANAGGVVIS